MPTLLVKGLSESTLKQLKRLKVELDCDTWAELLERLSRGLPARRSFTKEQLQDMRDASKKLAELSEKASRKWRGPPGVVDEFRKARRHERVPTASHV
jgi:hypothetical protein